MQLLTLELEDDYNLIGIHTTEEDYRLAYLLNKHLNTRLVRFKEVLDFKDSSAEFPLFEYIDEKSFINYYLINNKHLLQVPDSDENSLFEGSYYATSYLVPEKRNVDFFLKITGNYLPNLARQLVHRLNAIDQVITSYEIDPESLKSKEHLIF
jgi:hypothetical protein